MRKCRVHLSDRVLFSFLLIWMLVLAVGISLLPARVFAGQEDDAGEKTRKYLVDDSGMERLISDKEYERLKNSGDIVPPTSDEEDLVFLDQGALLQTATQAPTYNGVFEVYSRYFNYYPYNVAGANTQDDLYLEYSSDGGKHWKRSGYMRFNWIKLATQQGYEISGLKPNTTYRTRIRYGTDGPVKKTTTIKTGMAKKPAIKSVTAKAVKVKYHKVKHYGYYTGVYLYTEKFYTYKVKVTVKLKKKPGSKGVLLACSDGTWKSAAWIKGNKKTYTKIFTPYPNYSKKHPRRRITVAVGIQSAQDKKWGGLSPAAIKKRKLS